MFFYVVDGKATKQDVRAYLSNYVTEFDKTWYITTHLNLRWVNDLVLMDSRFHLNPV